MKLKITHHTVDDNDRYTPILTENDFPVSVFVKSESRDEAAANVRNHAIFNDVQIDDFVDTDDLPEIEIGSPLRSVNVKVGDKNVVVIDKPEEDGSRTLVIEDTLTFKMNSKKIGEWRWASGNHWHPLEDLFLSGDYKRRMEPRIKPLTIEEYLNRIYVKTNRHVHLLPVLSSKLAKLPDPRRQIWGVVPDDGSDSWYVALYEIYRPNRQYDPRNYGLYQDGNSREDVDLLIDEGRKYLQENQNIFFVVESSDGFEEVMYWYGWNIEGEIREFDFRRQYSDYFDAEGNLIS